MAARIRSLRNGITPVDEASRDDLTVGDVVVVSSLDAATTYAWTITFAPDGSLATFSGSSTAISPGSFTVDAEGPYLIRLVVDQALPTQDTQWVRLRALTSTLGLTLVAAGERRDGTGIIPVDVSSEGWANEQNNNLLNLELATQVVEDFASTLVAGNETGGTDLVLSSGDIIQGEEGAALGGDVTLVGGTPTSGVSDGGDVVLRPGAGLGGGASGVVRIQNALATQSVRISVVAADTIQIDTGAGGGLPLEYDTASGKLTVPGVIDPTAVILSDPALGTELYFESADGSTAPLAPANSGRLRYNNSTLLWEFSADGAAYDRVGGAPLSHVLSLGEETGGSDIILSSGDVIRGEIGATLAEPVTLVGGTASGPGPFDGGDIRLRPGAGVGGGQDGFISMQDPAGGTGARFKAGVGTLRMIFDESANGTRDFVTWAGQTVGAGAAEIFLENPATQYLLDANSAVKFTIEVVAIEDVGGADSAAGFRISGIIKRGALVASTAIVGQTLETTGVDAPLAGATATVSADVATGALRLFVTGVALITLNWSATMTSARVLG